MRVNAALEKFELVEVFGHQMLFTCLRVDRATVPEGYHMYEVRHDDDSEGIPCQIGKWIMVNHWGTVISNRPIELERSGLNGNEYRDLRFDGDEWLDWNYEGAICTLAEYMAANPPSAEVIA